VAGSIVYVGIKADTKQPEGVTKNAEITAISRCELLCGIRCDGCNDT